MKKIIHCDERGYCLVVKDGLYSAGCHKGWTKKEALNHWGGKSYPNPDRGAGFVEAIKKGQEIESLPEGLRWLYLGGGTLPEGFVLPEGLEELFLRGGTLPEGIVLPEGLVVLFLGGGTLPEGTVLPESLEQLRLGGGTLPEGTVLPEGLRID